MFSPGRSAPAFLIPPRGRIVAVCRCCGGTISVPIVRSKWIRHPAGKTGGYQLDPTCDFDVSVWLAAHRGPVRAYGVLTG